jgi:three-Cys-motif partner protein
MVYQFMDSDALFDGSGYREAQKQGSTPGELADALALDRETTLVQGDDGLLARKVALHSLDKAHYAHYYADIVGRAMQNAYPGPLAWVELFAGPGRLYVKDLNTFKAGSPIEALTIPKPFNYYVFADLDPRCTEALRERVARQAPTRPNVHILDGNANAADLHDRIVSIVPKNALVVLYGDPAGLDLNFSTLQFFAKRYKHLDLLLNFPVPGVVRALRAGHEGKASMVLNHPAPLELIGPTSGRPGLSLRDWLQRQLGALGYDQFAAEVIKLHAKNVPLYDLMLASREERAKRLFGEAVKRGPGGQYTMNLDC